MKPDDKFEYFIQRTNLRLDKIDGKLDQLLEFKWQIIGGAGILSILVTIVIQVGSWILDK